MTGVQLLFQSRKESPPETLSTADRHQGRRYFRRFLKLNGISVAFLIENMLILYAIRNGVSDPLVATLASFIHLTMPLMVFGKNLVARIGAARTWGLGWFFRYLSASIMILAPATATIAPQSVVSGIILLGAFGFAAFRSIGIVGNTPMMGEVTTPEDRGNFLSGNFVRANSTHLIAMSVVILVLSVTDAIWVYQAILAVGCGLGFYAGTILARIPESRTPRESASKPFKVVIRNLWGSGRMRRLLYAWSAGFVAFTVVIPFSMITVKNGYGISDYLALTFSLPLLLGGIASALVNGVIADRVGPRPLLLLYTSGLLLVAGFWAFAPEQFRPFPVGLAFFAAGYCKFGIIVSVGHYFLSAVDETDRVGSSIFMRLSSGAAAGLAASVVGGGLLQILPTVGYEGMDVYRTYFTVALAAIALLLLVVRRLDRLEEWSIRSILGLLLSPRDMRALYVLNRLKMQSGSHGAEREVERLGDIGSNLSEGELREHLRSPRFSVRSQALRALGRISFGIESEEAIIRELRTGEYTTAWVAAEILGEHRIRRAVPLLREGLDSADPFLQGKCMVALVRLEDRESYPRINELFRESRNPRIVIHGANALARMEDNDRLYRLLLKSLEEGLPEAAVDEVLTAAATTVGEGGRFYQFLQRYNQNREAGIETLLPDLSSDVLAGDAARLRTESREEKPLTFFRRTLEESARAGCERSDQREAAVCMAVTKLFRSLGDGPLPRKSAFCVALLLSVEAEEDPIGYGVE
ncbi:MAG: MFS transporter [Alkalispirochaetaceae bacterium]